MRELIRLLAVGVAIAALVVGPLSAAAQSAAAQSAAAPSAPAQPPSPDVIGGRTVLIVRLRTPGGSALTQEQRDAAEAVISERLRALPDARLLLTVLPDDRLRFDLADPARMAAVERVVTAPGELRFVLLPEASLDVVEGQPLPDGLQSTPLLTNEDIERVSMSTDSLERPALDIRLTPTAAVAFDDWAADHMGERLAIVLDGVVVVAPTINAHDFGGEIQVSGWHGADDIMQVVAILTGGVLPVIAEALIVCPAPAGCPVPSLQPASSRAP